MPTSLPTAIWPRAQVPRKFVPGTTITVPTPDATIPAMPNSNLTGWTLQWSNDFDTDCAPGQFANPAAGYTGAPAVNNIGNGQFFVYPTSYKDTSKRGIYDPAGWSVSNSVLTLHVYTDGGGVHRVGAVVPKLNNQTVRYGAVGGRFAICYQTDILNTYKHAYLLWPDTQLWTDGEIDFPEANLTGATTEKAFTHFPDLGTPPPQATAGTTTADPTSSTWKTAVIEWRPDVVTRASSTVKYYMAEGAATPALITNSTVTGVHVPYKSMHWVVQNETILETGTPIDPATDGYVRIAWMAFWNMT